MPQTEKFEHYELLKSDDGALVELGRGAMGVTYKAFDTNLRCNVALKVISTAYLDDATAKERFLREARGAAQIRHRNIASVFHLGRHGNSYFYAMEFIEGETVDAFVKREGPMDILLALDIGGQVASALIAAERQNLVHRDIKPSNLMLVREDDGEVLAKVIDFGLVKAAQLSSAAGTLTSSGFVGTPYFASPEQLDQRPEDIRSDIYSLGVTLWFMLTGKPTFTGSVASVIAQHFDKAPAFESLARLPSIVVGVLRRMLEKDLEKRFQTPTELRVEIKRCLETLKAARPSAGAAVRPLTYHEGFETVALTSAHGLESKLSPGVVLAGRYRLIEDLNPADPNQSFHAEDITLRRRVRVKIVRADAAGLAQILEECERVKATPHPYFIDVLATGRASGFGFVVLEWIDGFSLVELLRARRELTLRETLKLLDHIAPAVDAAREYRIPPALQLHDILVHFPEGFREPESEVILRCPLAEWPGFVVKTNPLASLPGFETSGGDAAERTLAHDARGGDSLDIPRLGALTYDLLGGKPGGFSPLANVSEAGNDVLRRSLSARTTFTTAHEFLAALSASCPADAGRSASASAAVRLDSDRPAASCAGSCTSTPAQSGPREELAATPSRTPAIVVGVALLAALGVAAAWLFRVGQETDVPRVSPAAPLQKPAAANSQPRKPGEPWNNTLDMAFVPLGRIHFATTKTRVRDFEAFVQATGYDAVGGMYSAQRDGFKQHGHSWKNPGFAQSPDHPVVGISWEDANNFCVWLTQKERAEGALTAIESYRLPSDLEWSEAAGLPREDGGTPEERNGAIKAVYPWGRSFPPPGEGWNYLGSEAMAGLPESWTPIPNFRDASPRTAAVAGGAANARGILDLGGNAWEWCADLYNKTSRWRVLRGGSWATSRPEEMLASYRRGFDPSFRHDDIGFRCVIAADSAR